MTIRSISRSSITISGIWCREEIRDMVQRGAVKLQYVATYEQIADVLTKPLAKVKFEYFRENLGIL